MNAELRQRTNTKDIVALAYSLKCKWRGHVARTDRRSWAQAASMSDVSIAQGKLDDRRLDGQARSS